MILHVARTALLALRRDRGALVLSFVLPIGFFSIFAAIFGGMHDTTPQVKVIVADEDRSAASRTLIAGLKGETSLVVALHPAAKSQTTPPPADYTAATAAAAVKAGDAPVALVIPSGFGQHPLAFGPDAGENPVHLLYDASDSIAPQIVMGMLQKAAMTAMPATMAEEGMKTAEKYLGELTPKQRQAMQTDLAALRKEQAGGKANTSSNAAKSGSDGLDVGLIRVKSQAVVGQTRRAR